MVLTLLLSIVLAGCARSLETGLKSVGSSIDAGLTELGGGPKTTDQIIKSLEDLLASPKPNRYILAMQAIRKVTKEKHPGLTKYLEQHAAELPPVLLYELSARVYAHDRWHGVFWYYVARVRYTYDLMRCVDPTVMARLNGADRFANGPVTEIRLSPKQAYGVALTALRWDREHPIHTALPVGECASGESYQFAHNKDAVIRTAWPDDSPYLSQANPKPLFEDEWIRPHYEYDAILKQARDRVRADVDALAEIVGILPEAWHD